MSTRSNAKSRDQSLRNPRSSPKNWIPQQWFRDERIHLENKLVVLLSLGEGRLFRTRATNYENESSAGGHIAISFVLSRESHEFTCYVNLCTAPRVPGPINGRRFYRSVTVQGGRRRRRWQWRRPSSRRRRVSPIFQKSRKCIDHFSFFFLFFFSRDSSVSVQLFYSNVSQNCRYSHCDKLWGNLSSRPRMRDLTADRVERMRLLNWGKSRSFSSKLLLRFVRHCKCFKVSNEAIWLLYLSLWNTCNAERTLPIASFLPGFTVKGI